MIKYHTDDKINQTPKIGFEVSCIITFRLNSFYCYSEPVFFLCVRRKPWPSVGDDGWTTNHRIHRHCHYVWCCAAAETALVIVATYRSSPFVDILHCVSIKRVEMYLIAAQTITLHSSYFEWPKYKTAKPLLYTVYRTGSQKQ